MNSGTRASVLGCLFRLCADSGTALHHAEPYPRNFIFDALLRRNRPSLSHPLRRQRKLALGPRTPSMHSSHLRSGLCCTQIYGLRLSFCRQSHPSYWAGNFFPAAPICDLSNSTFKCYSMTTSARLSISPFGIFPHERTGGLWNLHVNAYKSISTPNTYAHTLS